MSRIFIVFVYREEKFAKVDALYFTPELLVQFITIVDVPNLSSW